MALTRATQHTHTHSLEVYIELLCFVYLGEVVSDLDRDFLYDFMRAIQFTPAVAQWAGRFPGAATASPTSTGAGAALGAMSVRAAATYVYQRMTYTRAH